MLVARLPHRSGRRASRTTTENVGEAPAQHIVFGYLQVGEVVQGEHVRDFPWHPHAENPDPLPNNTLYLAAGHLMTTGLPGAGVLDYREDRVLTARANLSRDGGCWTG
ncbi:MAG: hypothetical protein VB093_07380 [Propionicimonas sp.]|nr:hypothetical protein [Propionicimonas sp.]MEA5118399.1 hypothetical protein [Propionicimonas sp.]